MDIGTMLDNAKTAIERWGSSLLVVLGVIIIIWMGVLIAMKLMKKGQDQTSVAKIIAGILIGGAFMAGGFSLLNDASQIGKDTIDAIIN